MRERAPTGGAGGGAAVHPRSTQGLRRLPSAEQHADAVIESRLSVTISGRSRPPLGGHPYLKLLTRLGCMSTSVPPAREAGVRERCVSGRGGTGWIGWHAGAGPHLADLGKQESVARPGISRDDLVGPRNA